MANVWMHNGFLQVEGEKMSKSLGNFVTIHELLHTEKFGGRKWPGEVLRLAMLRTHYRQPIDWTVKALEEAEKTLERWAQYARYSDGSEVFDPFVEALADDLNFANAEAEMHARTRIGVIADYSRWDESTWASDDEVRLSSANLRFCLQLVGLDSICDPSWNKVSVSPDFASRIEEQVKTRLAARASKNWAESDRIRDELAAMGIALKDNKDGTTSWEVKR